MTLSPDAKPRLWRLARVRYDEVRRRSVLLYPEGAVLLNETAAEILSLCDGERTVADIASMLGEKYQADVGTDVTEYLSMLVDRELVHVAGGGEAHEETRERGEGPDADV